MKICRTCGKEKPLNEFGKNKSYTSGYTYDCKICMISKKKHYQYTCKICGKNFESPYKNRQYCSKACGDEGKTFKPLIPWEEIGEKYYTTAKMKIGEIADFIGCSKVTLERKMKDLGFSYGTNIDITPYKIEFEKIGYKLLEEIYKGSNEQWSYICDKGHKNSMRWCNFQNGDRCPDCYHESMKLDYEYVKQGFNSEGYELLEKEYIGSKHKMKIKCPKGHLSHMSWHQFNSQGMRCVECNKQNQFKETKAAVEKEVLKIGYEFIGIHYKGNELQVEWRCDKKHEVVTRWSHFRNGTRCSICNESKGERAIRRFLRKNHIPFKEQYTFPNCRNIRPLPFDFIIKLRNKKVALIEYQGEQHYKPVEFFGGREKLKLQQINDDIKRTYCRVNNIPLIEIPYWEEDVEGFLIKELDMLNEDIQLALL